MMMEIELVVLFTMSEVRLGFFWVLGMEFLVKERSWNARNRYWSGLVTE